MDNTCFRHTDVFAFNTCVSCTKSICASCSIMAPEGTFCSERCMTVYREMKGWVETGGKEAEKPAAVPLAAASPRPGPEPRSGAVAPRMPSPEDACARHPETEKVGVCMRCQKNVCPACLVEVSWGSFCSAECSVVYKGFEPQPERSSRFALKVGVFAILVVAAVFVIVQLLPRPGGDGTAGTGDAGSRSRTEEEARMKAVMEAETQRKAEEQLLRRTTAEAEARRMADASLVAYLGTEARRKADEEAARLRAAEEARKKAAMDEEAARLKAEEEARKKAAMDAEAKRKADEEAARLKAEEDSRRKAEEQAAAQLQRDQDEAGRLIGIATPLFKEVAEGIDPLPDNESALRNLLRKAQTAEVNLAEAQMLYRKVETKAPDPAAMKRRVDSLTALIDTLRGAVRQIQAKLQ